VVRKAIGDQERVTVRPGDLVEPGWDKAREEIGDLAQSEEDIMSYALFPREAREFFELRRAGRVAPITEPRIFAAEPTPVPKAAPVTTGVAPAASKVEEASSKVSLWRVAGRLG